MSGILGKYFILHKQQYIQQKTHRCSDRKEDDKYVVCDTVEELEPAVGVPYLSVNKQFTHIHIQKR